MSFTLESVTFAYPGKPPVFRAADAAVAPGALTAVTGPSGSGKSTLLRLLCRLEEPDEGTIAFEGEPLPSLPPHTLRTRALYLQQTPTVLDGSVRENLLAPFTLAANAAHPRPDDATLLDMLDRFLLRGVTLEQTARGLSVGQLQRLCLMRALLLSPRALLLDEPTSALDPESAAVVTDTALELASGGMTVVYVAHDASLASRSGVHALRLENGKAVQ